MFRSIFNFVDSSASLASSLDEFEDEYDRQVYSDDSDFDEEEIYELGKSLDAFVEIFDW